MSKKDRVFEILSDDPSLTNQKIANIVGVHRNTIVKYRKEFDELVSKQKEAEAQKINEMINTMSHMIYYQGELMHEFNAHYDATINEWTIHVVKQSDDVMNLLADDET